MSYFVSNSRSFQKSFQSFATINCAWDLQKTYENVNVVPFFISCHLLVSSVLISPLLRSLISGGWLPVIVYGITENLYGDHLFRYSPLAEAFLILSWGLEPFPFPFSEPKRLN